MLLKRFKKVTTRNNIEANFHLDGSEADNGLGVQPEEALETPSMINEIPGQIIRSSHDAMLRMSFSQRILKGLLSLSHKLPIVFEEDEYDSAMPGIDPGYVDRATEAARLRAWKIKNPEGLTLRRAIGVIAID